MKFVLRLMIIFNAPIVFVFSFLFLSSSLVSALSGGQFQAGRIMDDSVFFNKNTMSTYSVQQFLEAKVPTCDTNGTQPHASGMSRADYGTSQGSPPPYTCLKDFRQETPTRTAEAGLCNGFIGGNKSGAQIIVEVADSCGINPQVLIVLLQKEQSLITDNWPWPIQYRSATGYGCPDTAPCDAEFYGFFNQVYSSAKQFKRYALTPSSFNFRPGRTSFIQYNPNASCGGSNVFLQNQATAGLYNYTPYQPNASALDNLYDSGDACGAYGNRNFWRMFNDWFGPTMGPLIRSPSSPELFYSDGAQKYRAGSINMIMEYGLGLNDVRIISQSEMDALPLASGPNTPNLSYVVKSNSDTDDDGGNIYLITNGKRYHIPSMTVFSDFGFQLNQIGYLPLGQLARLPVADTLSNFVRASHAGYVFKVQGGQKRSILDYDTFIQQNPSGVVQDISPFVLDSLPTGQIILNGNAVLRDSGGGIWLIVANTWHYVSSMSTYECLGLGGLKNISFASYQAYVSPQGADASCAVQTSTSQRFIMDGWRRIPIDNAWGFTNFFSVDDNIINRLPIYNPTSRPLFRVPSDGILYTFEGGKKRQIINMASFSANGYENNDIFTSATNFLSTIPTGAYKLADGMVVSDAGTGQLYAISGNSKLYIPSMNIFHSYGFLPTAIIPLDRPNLSGYTTGSNLQRLARTPGATFFESGIAIQIPTSLEAHYGVNGSTPTYPSGIKNSIQYNVQATRYLKFQSSATLFYLENGVKRPVYSWERWAELGGRSDNIMILSDPTESFFPTGTPM